MSFKYFYLLNVFCIIIQLYDAVNLFIPEFVNTLKKNRSSGNIVNRHNIKIDYF